MSQTNAPSWGTAISAAFLVAGTCIGGGMLILPLATGLSGFLPSIVSMVVCWAMMTATALLLMEVNLSMSEGAHVISMSGKMLGWPGKVVAWILYLFISYASLVGYTAGGGGQVAHLLEKIFSTDVSRDFGCLVFVLAFGSVIYLGNKIVGRVNTVLFLAMIGAYIAVVGMGIDEVKSENFFHTEWSSAWMALPILLTSFSFQTMVPSLSLYLNKQSQNLRFAIIGGTTISLLVYLIWQWLILGIVPLHGDSGLLYALRQGEAPTQFVSEHVVGSYIAPAAEFFAFFALVTSFLGIALGLFDFLSDGLKIQEQGVGQIALAILVVVPTLFFATHFERAFLIAFETTGGFGDAILNGMMPVMMAWVARYRFGHAAKAQIPGGKPVLIAIFLFYTGILVLEILMTTRLLPSIFNQ